MNLQEYIRPELLVLIPVLYLLGAALKKSALKDKWIPFILGLAGIVLSALWLVATSDFAGVRSVFEAIFAAITQGVLAAGASVYVNQLAVQARKED